jgi:hypothetical protein
MAIIAGHCVRVSFLDGYLGGQHSGVHLSEVVIKDEHLSLAFSPIFPNPSSIFNYSHHSLTNTFTPSVFPNIPFPIPLSPQLFPFFPYQYLDSISVSHLSLTNTSIPSVFPIFPLPISRFHQLFPISPDQYLSKFFPNILPPMPLFPQLFPLFPPPPLIQYPITYAPTKHIKDRPILNMAAKVQTRKCPQKGID